MSVRVLRTRNVFSDMSLNVYVALAGSDCQFPGCTSPHQP